MSVFGFKVLTLLFILFIGIATIYGIALFAFPPDIVITFEEEAGTKGVKPSERDKAEITSTLKKRHTNVIPFGDEYNIRLSHPFYPRNPAVDYLYLITGSVEVLSPWSFHYLDNGDSSWGFVLGKKDIAAKWEIVNDKLCCADGLEWY